MRVLAVGVYLADRDNRRQHIAEILSHATTLDVTLRWTGIGLAPASRPADPDDHFVTRRAPRFKLLNDMLRDAADFDWIIITDDDIDLAPGFPDALIGVADRLGFALCQPARTRDSFIDHPITAEIPGLIARRTSFVEIGPVIAMSRDAARILLPFDETTEMGWGLDYVWPVLISRAGLAMGIIDAVPIAHRMRPPAATYSGDAARAEQRALLARQPRLDPNHAFRVHDIVTG